MIFCGILKLIFKILYGEKTAHFWAKTPHFILRKTWISFLILNHFYSVVTSLRRNYFQMVSMQSPFSFFMNCRYIIGIVFVFVEDFVNDIYGPSDEKTWKTPDVKFADSSDENKVVSKMAYCRK